MNSGRIRPQASPRASDETGRCRFPSSPANVIRNVMRRTVRSIFSTHAVAKTFRYVRLYINAGKQISVVNRFFFVFLFFLKSEVLRRNAPSKRRKRFVMCFSCIIR